MPVRLNFASSRKQQGVDPDSRRRSWLNGYEFAQWIVKSESGAGGDQIIDFDVRMADGRSLLHHYDLCATAKEFVFWIRESNFVSFKDSKRHKQYGDTILRLCYGLTARGIYSFSSLTSIDIDTICAEAAFGSDGLTTASKIAKNALAEIASWETVPQGLAKRRALNADAVIERYNLPVTWARREVRSEIKAATARLNGKIIASVADVKETPIVANQIATLTIIFEGLFSLRHHIEAPSIAFRPFPEGAMQRANDLGKFSTRTPIPPAELTLRLMERSTRHLLENGDAVIALVGEIEHERRNGGWKRKKAEAIRRKINALGVACYVLIATFTARRTEETKKLERDCLAGNDLDGWWMKIYIEKTEQQRTWIPVPNIVARSVRTLATLSPEGMAGPDGLLFEYLDPVTAKYAELAPEKILNDFADMVGAREYANDNTKTIEKWSWVTRQFRRFFAVLFFYRYKGKIETLAHHLRHFNLEMTNDYVTLDPENAKTWMQEVAHYQVEVARDVVSGRSEYIGPMGKRLTQLAKRLRDRFASSVLVVSEVIGRALVRQMKKNQLVLTPKLWVTCTSPRNRKSCEKAACRKAAGYNDSDVGPDFSAAGPTVCPGCPFALIGRENLAYIEEQRTAMAANAASGEGTIFAELQAANVLTLSDLNTAA